MGSKHAASASVFYVKKIGEEKETAKYPDIDGIVELSGLEPGTYSVSAQLPGEAAVTRELVLPAGASIFDLDIAKHDAKASDAPLADETKEQIKLNIGILWIVNGVWLIAAAVAGWFIVRLAGDIREAKLAAERARSANKPARQPSYDRQYVGTPAGHATDGRLDPAPRFPEPEEYLPIRIERLEKRVDRLDELADETSARRRPPIVLPPSVTPMSSLYAEVPEPDGSFRESALSSERSPLSVYEIRPNRDGQTATVTVCDNADVHQRALQNPKMVLLPVCQYEELPNRTHTKIGVIEHGRAERTADGWHVDRKITVRFS